MAVRHNKENKDNGVLIMYIVLELESSSADNV